MSYGVKFGSPCIPTQNILQLPLGIKYSSTIIILGMSSKSETSVLRLARVWPESCVEMVCRVTYVYVAAKGLTASAQSSSPLAASLECLRSVPCQGRKITTISTAPDITCKSLILRMSTHKLILPAMSVKKN